MASGVFVPFTEMGARSDRGTRTNVEEERDRVKGWTVAGGDFCHTNYETPLEHPRRDRK